MSASYEVDPGVSFERVDNGWGLGIYIYISSEGDEEL